MADAIDVRDVTVRYGRATALASVSLRVAEGSSVAIIGNNGAGKTSLLHAIMGLVSPASGSVRLFGDDMTGARPHRIVARGIVLVPEGRHVFADQTVHENLRLGWARQRAGRTFDQRLDDVFELLPELAGHRSRLAGALSGGQQQMLAIGRALMTEARVLLLDEPTLGLAPFLADRLFAMLRTLRERGTTVVVAEATPRRALDLCDDAYVFGLGTVRAHGTPNELEASGAVQAAYLG